MQQHPHVVSLSVDTLYTEKCPVIFPIGRIWGGVGGGGGSVATTAFVSIQVDCYNELVSIYGVPVSSMYYLIFEEKKISRQQKKHAKLPSMQRVKFVEPWIVPSRGLRVTRGIKEMMNWFLGSKIELNNTD